MGRVFVGGRSREESCSWLLFGLGLTMCGDLEKVGERTDSKKASRVGKGKPVEGESEIQEEGKV